MVSSLTKERTTDKSDYCESFMMIISWIKNDRLDVFKYNYDHDFNLILFSSSCMIQLKNCIKRQSESVILINFDIINNDIIMSLRNLLT